MRGIMGSVTKRSANKCLLWLGATILLLQLQTPLLAESIRFKEKPGPVLDIALDTETWYQAANTKLTTKSKEIWTVAYLPQGQTLKNYQQVFQFEFDAWQGKTYSPSELFQQFIKFGKRRFQDFHAAAVPMAPPVENSILYQWDATGPDNTRYFEIRRLITAPEGVYHLVYRARNKEDVADTSARWVDLLKKAALKTPTANHK
ncbi:MAG: hypothetical protein SFZ03_12335 [Candidatus Melainabacteria bacterium]|nr:hypothetical protein [Candidatus Melainabacteria bacterium]